MSFRRYPRYKDSGVEWLGEVPEHWGVARLKQIAAVWPSNVDKKSADDEMPVRLCNYTDVYYNDQITADAEFMTATASPAQIEKFTLRAGDTIITKDSETADDIAIAAYVPEDLPGVVCGYHLSMIRPRIPDAGRFIKRFFDSTFAKASVQVLANGLTRVGLTQYALDNLLVPLPPKEERAAISSFLDRETATIDSLVAEQQRLIELLKEKRQAVISHAVTRGLNPDAPMKPSGVEWLGDVPAHWTMTRLKYGVSANRGIQMGPFGGMLKDLSGTEGDYKLYGQENTISGDFSAGSRWLSSEQFAVLREYELLPRDVVLTRKGASIGYCRLVPEGIAQGVIDSDTIRVRIDPTQILDEFAALLMHEGYLLTEIYQSQKGAVLPGLNSTTIQNLLIALPPLREQAAIVEYVRERAAELDALEAEAERAITLLRERRAALISAAVTGKIDVRDPATAEAA